MKSILRYLTLSLVSSCVAHGAITLNVDVEGLRDKDGNKAPTSSRVVVVVSTLDGTFDDPVLTGGSFSAGQFISGGGSDDVVLVEFGLLDLGATSGNQLSFPNLASPVNATAGDPMRLMWFTESAGAGPLTGEHYGAITLSNTFPGDPANFSIAVLSTDATTLGPGLIAPAALGAGSMVVPEPSSALLLMISLSVLLGVRRSRR